MAHNVRVIKLTSNDIVVQDIRPFMAGDPPVLTEPTYDENNRPPGIAQNQISCEHVVAATVLDGVTDLSTQVTVDVKGVTVDLNKKSKLTLRQEARNAAVATLANLPGDVVIDATVKSYLMAINTMIQALYTPEN